MVYICNVSILEESLKIFLQFIKIYVSTRKVAKHIDEVLKAFDLIENLKYSSRKLNV